MGELRCGQGDTSLGRYVQRYGLAEACDDIQVVLRRVALTQGRTQRVKVLTGTGECTGGSLPTGITGIWGPRRGSRLH